MQDVFGAYLTGFPGIKHRICLIEESSDEYRDKVISGPEGMVEYLRPGFKGMDREMFVVLSLTIKYAPIGVNLVAVGSLTSCNTHPREVFKPAILANAACIVVAHNHPSGDVSPSDSDREFTDKIVEAGNLLSIKVLDHLIIGKDDRFFSFKQQGLC